MGPGINKATVLEQNWAMQLNWRHPCKSWFCVLSLLVLIIWSGITDLIQHYHRCHFVKALWLKAWKKAIAAASRNTGQRCQIVPEPEKLFQSHCLRTAIVCNFFLKCIVQCIFASAAISYVFRGPETCLQAGNSVKTFLVSSFITWQLGLLNPFSPEIDRHFVGIARAFASHITWLEVLHRNDCSGALIKQMCFL